MKLVIFRSFFLILLLGSAFALDDFVSEDQENDITGTSSIDFVIDSANAGGDLQLQFGDALGEFLRWNDTLNSFVLSDDLSLQGNQIVEARLENLATAPLCDGSAIGRFYFNTTSNNSFVCNGTDWEQIDASGIASSTNIPFLESINGTIAPSETKTLTLSGYNFAPGTTVSSNFPGTINSVTVISPSQIDLNLTAGPATGNYDIVIDTGGVDNTAWSNNEVDRLVVGVVSGTGTAGTYTESFEANLGSWVDSGLQQPWTRDSGGTPSGNTGPNGASVGTFYLYTETSTNGAGFPNRTFGIETTDFAVAQSISFDYHMFGADIGILEVQTLRSGVWTTRQTITGQQQANQGSAYLNQFVDLSPFDVEAIRFFYTSGGNFAGDCTIDNVVIVSS